MFRKKNLIFKGTNSIDTRLNGHPALIPIDIDFNDDVIYFFTISSQIQHYVREKERYFMLSPQRGTGIRTASIVDLKYVYKCERKSYNPEGYVHNDIVEKIINKFASYPDVELDDDCNELLSKIN